MLMQDVHPLLQLLKKIGDEFIFKIKIIKNLIDLKLNEEKQIIKQVCNFYNVIKCSAQN